MTQVENGNRYQAVKEGLYSQPGVIVVGETSLGEKINHKKANRYDERFFAVVSESGQDIRSFAESLLPRINPLSRHEADKGILKTFDRLDERSILITTIQVYPSVEAAQEMVK